MQEGSSTTVRVSRETQQVLVRLADAQGRSVTDLLARLAEQARRQWILDQSAARMTEIMADPTARAAYEAEFRASEEAAASVGDA